MTANDLVDWPPPNIIGLWGHVAAADVYITNVTRFMPANRGDLTHPG